MEISIIGAGIAGELAAHLLLESGHGVKIYDPDGREGIASWNSTGVVGSFGVATGHSPLGDLLVQALPVALEFYRHFNHSSIEVAPIHYHGEGEAYQRRFGHLSDFQEAGLLIDCPAFMEELRQRNDRLGLERIQRYITSWDQVGECAATLYAPGAMRCLFSLDGELSKPRPGTSLQWQGDFGPQSLHYHFHGKGVVSYRKGAGKLLLAAVNSEQMMGLGDLEACHQFYLEMRKLSPIALPPFGQAKLLSGVRELARDRVPKLQDLGHGRYLLNGFHRNGLTLAPYFARKAQAQIKMRGILE